MDNRRKILEAIVKYTTAAVLIFVPLFPKFPLVKVQGTFTSIRLEDLLMVFAALTVAVVFFRKRKEITSDRLFRSIFLFVIIGLVSTFSAIYVTDTVEAHIAILHWIRRIEYFVPFFLGYLFVKQDRKNLGFFTNILLIIVCSLFIYGYGQKNLGWPVIITQNEEYSKGIALRYVQGSHINSTFAGHYDLATFLVLMLPFLITLFAFQNGRMKQLVIMISIFMGLWLLVNTASRVSLLAYLVSAVLALIFAKKHKLIPAVLIVSFVFAGFSGNLVSRYQRIIDVTKTKVNEFVQINYLPKSVYAEDSSLVPTRREILLTPTPTPVFEDRSTNIRLNVEWPRALRAFYKNPFLGTGYSSITLATDNDYLRLLGEVGILGFFAFFLIFARLFVEILDKFPFYKFFNGTELAFVGGMMGALPGIFINAFFIDVFEASKFAILFWLLLGMLVSLLRNSKPNIEL